METNTISKLDMNGSTPPTVASRFKQRDTRLKERSPVPVSIKIEDSDDESEEKSSNIPSNDCSNGNLSNDTNNNLKCQDKAVQTDEDTAIIDVCVTISPSLKAHNHLLAKF